MSKNPYGMHGTPAVGKGLGGLPRRKDVAKQEFNINNVKILNQSFLKTTTSPTGSINIGFIPTNPRCLFFEFMQIPSASNWTAGKQVCQVPLTGDLDYNNSVQSYKKLCLGATDTSSSKFSCYLATGNNLTWQDSAFTGTLYIKVTEYYLDVVSRQRILWDSGSAPYPTYTLTTPINNIKSVFIEGYHSSPSSQQSSIGNFCNDFLQGSTSTFHCLDNQGIAIIKNSTTVEITGAGSYGMVIVTEFKEKG